MLDLDQILLEHVSSIILPSRRQLNMLMESFQGAILDLDPTPNWWHRFIESDPKLVETQAYWNGADPRRNLNGVLNARHSPF